MLIDFSKVSESTRTVNVDVDSNFTRSKKGRSCRKGWRESY